MSTDPTPDADLSQELRELGELIKRVVQTARAHPHVKDFDQKISQAVGDLSARIDAAAQSTREPLKTVGAQVKHAAQAYQESGAADDIARGIAKSMRLLNEQIRKAIDELEKGSKS
jgi:methyl-accepting chemotaxis protein